MVQLARSIWLVMTYSAFMRITDNDIMFWAAHVVCAAFSFLYCVFLRLHLSKIEEFILPASNVHSDSVSLL
jgi:hypothetical protein